MFMRPWLSFSDTTLSFTNWKNNFRTQVVLRRLSFSSRTIDHQCLALMSIEIWIEGAVAGQHPHLDARALARWHSSLALGARLRRQRALYFSPARYSRPGRGFLIQSTYILVLLDDQSNRSNRSVTAFDVLLLGFVRRLYDLVGRGDDLGCQSVGIRFVPFTLDHGREGHVRQQSTIRVAISHGRSG